MKAASRRTRAASVAAAAIVLLSCTSEALAGGHFRQLRGAAANQPALNAAVLTSMAFIAVALAGCAVMAAILYRRSVAPRQPHHLLLEELEEDEHATPQR